MASSAKYNGSLVAFEGPSELVSIQLRLLPTSPQILVLPPITSFLKDDSPPDLFDSRSLIRSIHEASVVRADVALRFLQQSRPGNRRLVFLNGGTVGAHALCIGAIRENETGGDLREAEAVYYDLVRGGIDSISDAEGPAADSAGVAPPAVRRVAVKHDEPLTEDPAKRAMKAADDLYEQTDSLEPEDDFDMTYRPRPRSLSLPSCGYTDQFRDATSAGLMETVNLGNEIPDQPGELGYDKSVLNESSEDDLSLAQLSPKTVSTAGETFGRRSPPRAGESGEPDILCSPSSMSRISALSPDMKAPPSPSAVATSSEQVTYGKARMIQVRASIGAKPLRRSQSLSRFRARSGTGWYSITSSVADQDGTSEEEMRLNQLQPPVAIYSATEKGNRRSRPAPLDLPPSAFLSNPSRNGDGDVAAKPEDADMPTARLPYVDGATETASVEMFKHSLSKSDNLGGTSSEPVLPLIEDLIIYLTEGDSEELLGHVLQGFQDGTYPLQQLPPCESEPDDSITTPGTPNSQAPTILSASRPVPGLAASPTAESSVCDPFPFNGDFGDESHQSSRNSGSSKMTAIQGEQQPPTPMRTPSPSLSDPTQIFYTFSTSSDQAGVWIQNGLRSVLNGYFPPEPDRHHKFYLSFLPNLDGLWRPLFGEIQPSSPRQSGHNVDLILAIGSEAGVNRDYVSSLTGQIEKLGSKSSGISRGGRLDLRYLIANAMQTFTSQAYINQTQDSPFTSLVYLATLVVLHLETYLAANPAINFLLLEYTAEQLSVVLALQQLIGVDLFKVAGIIDSEAGEPVPLSPHKPPSHRSSTSVHSKASSVRSASFSKANFILTSSATESEIASFISAIWRELIEISQFYAPEPSPRPGLGKKGARKPPPLPLSVYNHNTKNMQKINSTASGATSQPGSPGAEGISTPIPARSISPAASNMSKVSVADTVRTARTGRSAADRGRSVQGSRRDRMFLDVSGRHTPSSSIFSMETTGDSDFEADERRLMPLYMRTQGPRRGNSRKALKWLGLA